MLRTAWQCPIPYRLPGQERFGSTVCKTRVGPQRSSKGCIRTSIGPVERVSRSISIGLLFSQTKMMARAKTQQTSANIWGVLRLRNHIFVFTHPRAILVKHSTENESGDIEQCDLHTANP